MTRVTATLLVGLAVLSAFGPSPSQGLTCYLCGEAAKFQNEKERDQARQGEQPEHPTSVRPEFFDIFAKPCREDGQEDTTYDGCPATGDHTPACITYWTNDRKVARDCVEIGGRRGVNCDDPKKKCSICTTGDKCNGGPAPAAPPKPELDKVDEGAEKEKPTGSKKNETSVNGTAPTLGSKFGFGTLVVIGLAVLPVIL